MPLKFNFVPTETDDDHNRVSIFVRLPDDFASRSPPDHKVSVFGLCDSDAGTFSAADSAYKEVLRPGQVVARVVHNEVAPVLEMISSFFIRAYVQCGGWGQKTLSLLIGQEPDTAVTLIT